MTELLNLRKRSLNRRAILAKATLCKQSYQSIELITFNGRKFPIVVSSILAHGRFLPKSATLPK